MHARAGPHVDHVVRQADRLLVMLHDEDRVPQVAQPEQRIQEPAVVALMQADARFIQDVQDADEGRADLGGKPDALAFAAGKGRRAPVEREVVQAHVDHESQAFADLLQDPVRNGGLFFREREVREERQRFRDAHVRHFMDVQTRDLDGQRFLAEPAAAAVRAGLVAHVLLQLPLGSEGVGLVVAFFEDIEDAFEGAAGLAAACRFRGFGRAVEQQFLLGLLQVLDRAC